MTDIVERLRDEAILPEELQPLREEAAVEIIRLRLTTEERDIIAAAKDLFHAAAQHEVAYKLRELLERVQ
ncbi:hypothetical protein [Sphingorhabdus sp.]|uniref:hypothetical protein n=1 Tax=Sphingorhabdus sp. TaxID=1902408 RepID=UPI0033406AE5